MFPRACGNGARNRKAASESLHKSLTYFFLLYLCALRLPQTECDLCDLIEWRNHGPWRFETLDNTIPFIDGFTPTKSSFFSPRLKVHSSNSKIGRIHKFSTTMAIAQVVRISEAPKGERKEKSGVVTYAHLSNHTIYIKWDNSP